MTRSTAVARAASHTSARQPPLPWTLADARTPGRPNARAPATPPGRPWLAGCPATAGVRSRRARRLRMRREGGANAQSGVASRGRRRPFGPSSTGARHPWRSRRHRSRGHDPQRRGGGPGRAWPRSVRTPCPLGRDAPTSSRRMGKTRQRLSRPAAGIDGARMPGWISTGRHLVRRI